MSNDQNRRARLLAGNSFLLCVLISFVLVVYASAIELFRYNLTTPDGRKFQYIFDVSDPASQSAGEGERLEPNNRTFITYTLGPFVDRSERFAGVKPAYRAEISHSENNYETHK